MGAPQHIEDASTLYNNTLLYALYGPDLDNVFVSAINISFGQKGHQPTGHQPTGHQPTRHRSTGNGPTDHRPTGHRPTGHGPT